jgi:glycerol-3-phosphate cytidylyltransferase
MLVARDEIEALCKRLRNEGKTIVFTNGCFDIIHSGHVSYLTKAKGYADILLIGLNSDASVKRLKGKERPINNETDRGIVLGSLKSVDYVVVFEEDTPKKLIEQVKPNVLVKGGDYTIDTIVGADFVRANGGEVHLISFVDGKSTTSIINKMKGQ